MPYDYVTVQKCLATIQSVSPEIELVRTEIYPVNGSQPLQQFTLVRANGRLELRVAHTLQLSDEDQRRLCGFLKISLVKATALIAQLSNLHAINHYGTWVVSAAQMPGLLIGGESRSLLNCGSSLLADVHESLVDALPGVHEFRVEACMHMNSSGTLRRRPCIRAMATDDIELAAIDTSLFPAHLQALLLPREFSKAHHHRRVAAWASQLGVHVETMAGILDDLGLLAVSLPVTRIVLRPATETASYWKHRAPRRQASGNAMTQ